MLRRREIRYIADIFQDLSTVIGATNCTYINIYSNLYIRI